MSCSIDIIPPKPMTEFIFTKHVGLRIEQRTLDRELIKDTLQKPDRVLPGLFGRNLAQKDFGGKTLEVVYVKENDDLIIITAYFLKRGEK